MRSYYGSFILSVGKTVLRFGTCAAILAILLFCDLQGSAQIVPNFTSGGQTPLLTSGSPKLAYFNGYVYLAYINTSNGDLDIARSADGVSWTNLADTGHVVWGV